MKIEKINGFTYLTVNDSEYLICENESKMYEAVSEFIEETLFAFNPKFLCNYIDLPEEQIKHIQSLYEDGNGILAKLVDNWEDLVKDAIAADGIGHFLSPYDGQEIDLGTIIDDQGLDEDDYAEIVIGLEQEGFQEVNLITPVFRVNYV